MKKCFISIVLLIVLLACVTLGLCACNKNDPFAKNYPEFFSVQYVANLGGTIEGKDVQLVKYAKSSEEVTAVASDGYYFLRWTDGITTPTRSDKLITEDVKYYAEFAPITKGIEVIYGIAGDGRIIGDSNQIIQYGTDARKVEAQERVSNGARFLGWSDGYTERTRHDKNITEQINVTAKFGFSVEYNVDGCGSIVGSSHQDVVVCEDAQPVTALPDKGYTFVGWSDGEKKATRTDKYIIEDKQITAIFEWRDTDYFNYHYNFATENRSQFNLTLTRGNLDGVKSIVPKREFFTFGGWYLDENFIEKAFDEYGNNLLDEEIFNTPSRDLYAKWTVNEEYVKIYKVLMVYVTAVDAKLKGTDGNMYEVHYRMNETEKQACYKITELFSEAINRMMDGLIKFEVDNYFTKDTINENCINNEAYKDGTVIYAYKIPELIESGILDEYRSVLTSFSFNKEQKLYPTFAGITDFKYASIPVDTYNLYDNVNNIVVDGDLNTYIHEFIHTIELSMTCFSFHKAYSPRLFASVLYKLFMLNQFPTSLIGEDPNGEEEIFELWANCNETVGIPYYAWANEFFDVKIETECVNGLPDGWGGIDYHDDGGYIGIDTDNYLMNVYMLKNIQHVPKGSRTSLLIPKAKQGYKFIGWSDGYEGENRIIENVTEDLNITAYFERQAYTVEYFAGEGGRIVGKAIQTLLVGECTEDVTVVPDEGYRFVGWSDGYENSFYPYSRNDYIGQNKYDENGELHYRLGFSVTAIFEKI